MSSEDFRVGYFHIGWLDDDTVQITNTRLNRAAILHGGDFEGLLSGMVESAHLSARAAIQKATSSSREERG